MIASLISLTILQGQPDFSADELRVRDLLKPLGGTMEWTRPDSSEEPTKKEGWLLSVDIENKGKLFDFNSIQPLKRLGTLRILGGSTVGKSLHVLPGLPELELLVVTGTGFVNLDLKWVGRCKSLKKLDFGGSRISARGLKYIASQRSLKRLFLYNTEIRDSDLDPLSTMTFLSQLVLPTSVTADAAEALSKKIPNTRLSRI